MDTGDATPIFVPQYPIPKKLEKTVSNRVNEWLSKGWIEKSMKGNPWAFPLMAAPKKDALGGMTAVRVCVHLRALNALPKNESYPIPRIQDLLMRHGGNKYFATLDQADSYHQWLINEKHWHRVAFVWNGVHYNFIRACFGIKTMTSLFRRVTNEILEWVDEAEGYIDDIIIAAENFGKFVEKGKEVLRRLNRYNIRLRMEKCMFVAGEVVHLGRVVGRNGFSPDPRKTYEIADWEEPKSVKSLHSFVCLAG